MKRYEHIITTTTADGCARDRKYFYFFFSEKGKKSEKIALERNLAICMGWHGNGRFGWSEKKCNRNDTVALIAIVKTFSALPISTEM